MALKSTKEADGHATFFRPVIGAELSFVSAYTNQLETDKSGIGQLRHKVNFAQIVRARQPPQPGAVQADDGGASLVLGLLPAVILQRKV